MSARKLWKVISISKTKGSRISKSLPYGEAHAKFDDYRKELGEGDTLYMMQVSGVAVGRVAVFVEAEELVINDVGGFTS